MGKSNTTAMGGSPAFPGWVTPSHNCPQLCDYAQMSHVQGHWVFRNWKTMKPDLNSTRGKGLSKSLVPPELILFSYIS